MRPIIVLAICLCLPQLATAERILITSDPQYGWFGDASCRRERASFRKVVEIVNQERFDALIILGDLADSYPRSRTRRARQVRMLLDDLRAVRSASVYLVAGNHDLGDHSSDWAVRQFEADFGQPARYTFRIAGHKFLVLNTTLIQNCRSRPRAYREQLDFIRRNADARFVLAHHPPFQRCPDEADGYFRWRTRPRREILALLAPGTYIFCGHTHRPFERLNGGWQVIGVGTCCAPWPNGGRSYGVLEISPESVRYTRKLLP